MVIFGWDASDFDWQRGPMDVAAARRDGIVFFTHKSSEGTSVRHGHFGEAMRRARDAGIPFLGAYHVVRSPANAGAEVAYCLATVNAAAPWWQDHPGWFWQIDLERWPYDIVAASEGEQFADIIEARTGRRAVIYASRGQYGDQLRGTDHPLWNANYPSSRVDHYRALYPGDQGVGWAAYSGVTPAIWQYSSKATIGSQPTCDANAFRGDRAAFAAMIGMGDEGMSESWTQPLTQGTAGYAGQQRDTALAFAWRSANEAAQSAAAILEIVKRIAVDVAAVPAAELAAIEAAAKEGAEAGTLAAADVLVAQIIAGVQRSAADLTPTQVEQVEQAVRDAFAGGLAPDEPVGDGG